MVPRVASQVVPPALPGTQHTGNVFFYSILKLCHGAKGDEKRVGHSLSRLLGGCLLARTSLLLCASHYWNRLTDITTETRMQLSQCLTPSQFLMFFHCMRVPYQENA